MPVIEVGNITKKYFKKDVLKGASFYVDKKECVGIIGANGCGKTTLLGIVSGSHKPTSGKIMIMVKTNKEKKAVFKYIAMYLQDNH